MSGVWIPGPVGVGRAVVSTMVAAVHVGRAVLLHGRHRYWHVGHVVTAAGMVVMFWPVEMVPALAGAGAAVFAAAAGLLTGLLVWARVRGVGLGPLWLASVADLAWMAVMFAMMTAPIAWLGAVGAAWFTAQALGWGSGRLGRALEGGGPGARTDGAVGGPGAPGWPPRQAAVDAGAAYRFDPAERSGAGAGVTPAGTRGRERRGRVVDGGRHDWSVRLPLTAMAVVMAYMLLAEPFGMGPMTGGSGAMPGM